MLTTATGANTECFRSGTLSATPYSPTMRMQEAPKRVQLRRDTTSPSEIPHCSVEIIAGEGTKRRRTTWPGMAAEIVQIPGSAKVVFRFRASAHLLVFFEQGSRHDGETIVAGARSTLHDVSRKLIFVPAGHDYKDSYAPRGGMRVVFFYLDQVMVPSANAEDRVSSLNARLFFEDATLQATAMKLSGLIENEAASDQGAYLAALGHVLAHELVGHGHHAAPRKTTYRGGLAAWQQRIVAAHIEENLGETIPLAELAKLVSLSPFHFCRAFKQSFGLPPHRYHTSRRIEHAKALLAESRLSITEIGLRVGFSESSSFTAAFRKSTGHTPTAYARSLA
jgi:AraC family transcriptional regulator